MTQGSHERHEGSAAACLLGALPEVEQHAFERHMMGCAACRDEVDRLRPAVEALSRSVAQLNAPASLGRSILDSVAAEGRPAGRRSISPALVERIRAALGRVRPAAAWASAAFLLAAGIATGYGASELADDADDAPDERTVAATVDRSRLVEGSGALLVSEDGDHAVLSVHGLPTLPDERARGTYQTWLVRGNEVIPSSLFSVGSDGSGAATIADGIGDADAVWVTRERAGGARAPTEPPLMRVKLD